MRRLRWANWVWLLALLGLYLGSSATTVNAEPKEPGEEDIRFLWAFGALKKGEGESKLIRIARDAALKSGDQIKFFVKLEEKCFVYLIYHSSQGEMSVLFPYRFEQLSRDYHKQAQYYIPQGNEWFELDEHTGQETFYLMASAKRLHELEALINQYETADPVKKSELAKEVLMEIRKLRKAHRKFKTFAEKPVNIMGHLRGSEKVEPVDTPDVTELAVEISGSKFYSRTFTIEHK